MKKPIKLISLVLSLLVLFAFAGCNQGSSLAAYKAAAKAELDDYAQENDYTPENWEVVLGLVAEGKTAIDAAINKPAVDAAVETAEQAIDEVEPREEDSIPFEVIIAEGFLGYGLKIIHTAGEFKLQWKGYVLEEYNEAFFSEKAVVIFEYTRGANCQPPQINAVTVEGKTLVLDVTRMPCGDLFTMSSWTFIIEVQKTDIIGVDDLIITYSDDFTYFDYS